MEGIKSLLSTLSAELGKDLGLLVHDFETTGLGNAAITEAALEYYVLQEGSKLIQARKASLVNPEKPIEPRAAEITGISNEMVRNQPNFGRVMGPELSNLYQCEFVIVGGFNSATYDVPLALKQFERYGLPAKKPVLQFDARAIELALRASVGDTNQKGKLVEVAQSYGVTTDESLHRACADVALTSDLINAMVLSKGVSAVVDAFLMVNGLKQKPVSAKSGSSRTVKSTVGSEQFLEWALKGDSAKLQEAAKDKSSSYKLGDLIDNGKIDIRLFFNEATTAAAMQLDSKAFEASVKLTSVKKHLESEGIDLDWIGIRAALFQADIGWVSKRF